MDDNFLELLNAEHRPTRRGVFYTSVKFYEELVIVTYERLGGGWVGTLAMLLDFNQALVDNGADLRYGFPYRDRGEFDRTRCVHDLSRNCFIAEVGTSGWALPDNFHNHEYVKAYPELCYLIPALSKKKKRRW